MSELHPRKNVSVGLGALWMCALWMCVLGACSRDPGADLIFAGGPVLTVNADNQVAEALAVRDGVIVAVGSVADVMAHRSGRTVVIDLKGRALLPGFVGAHEHPTLSAVFSGAIDLSGFTHKTNESVWHTLRQAVARTPKGEWIYAGGLDAMLTPDLRIPSRSELDAIAPEHPVVLVSQTLHSFWANSKAFAAAGITRSTPDPGAGSYYERDAQGELTGFVAETRAATPLLKVLKSPWPLYGRYVDVLDGLLAGGFTSVASLGYNVPPLLARVAASRRGQPRIRQFFYLVEDELSYLPDKPNTDNPFFRVLGIKLWHDGSPYTGSMLMSAPYLDSPLARALSIPPGSHGAAMLSDDALATKLRKYTAQGWQVAIHSQGDRSNRAVLDALAQAGPLPGQAPVVRLEHSVLLPASEIRRVAELGATASFHIHHILYYGDALERSLLGPQMAQQVLPVRTAFEHGVRPTLHADSPMFPAKAFKLMQTAIDRATRSGQTLNAAERIDVRQALRAMTVHGAWQLRLADKTGSLERGKWADLQIVDRSPYDVPVQELDRLKTEAVYVAGRRQFLAGSAP